jgi:hypothetical protein
VHRSAVFVVLGLVAVAAGCGSDRASSPAEPSTSSGPNSPNTTNTTIPTESTIAAWSSVPGSGTAPTTDEAPAAADTPRQTDTGASSTSAVRVGGADVGGADVGGADVGSGRIVMDFAAEVAIEGWSNVDDTVMGGVSASTTSWESGRMVFAGDLSIENNGGFTSVRSPQDVGLGRQLEGADGIGLVAEGDGKTYVLQLRTADEHLYVARFVTVDREQQRFELPFDEFEPVTRFLDPAPGAPPLDPSTVVQLAIYLLDGQVGPFRLAVTAIDAG